MLSPSKKERQGNHLRTIQIATFECDDGTVDIELALVDLKRFAYVDRERGQLEAGDPVHAINVRLSINPAFEVLAIETDLEAMPYAFCQTSAGNIGALIGKRLDKGWRHVVREALGATRGCTHLAELLPLAATAAFQTQAISRADEGQAIARHDAGRTEPPFFVGACHSWAADSPVTRKHFPQFDAPPEKPATTAKEG